MKKTISINIAGLPFVIDEDAYELLRNYIDTLRDAFRNTDDCREILTDIEARISELLAEMTEGRASMIVTLDDVENVISRIGKPEDMLEFEEKRTVSEETTDSGERVAEEKVTEEVKEKVVPPPYVPKAHIDKKLYRDPHDSMLGGVCSGLGWFFGIDATWVRLIAVAIAFLASVADFDTIYISLPAVVFLYIILWIVLPQANTPYERMRMKGESPSIDNIGRTVTDTFRKDNREEQQGQQSGMKSENACSAEAAGNGGAQIPPEYAPTQRSGFADTLARIFGAIAKVFLVILLIIAVPVFIGVCLGIVGCIFALLLFASQWGVNLWSEIGPGDMPDPVIPLLCAISYLFFFGIPLFLLIKATLFKNHKMGKSLKVALVILWIISLVGAPFTTAMLASDKIDFHRDGIWIENSSSYEETETVATPDTIYDAGTQTADTLSNP